MGMEKGNGGKESATYAGSKCVLQCEAGGVSDKYGAGFVSELGRERMHVPGL